MPELIKLTEKIQNKIDLLSRGRAELSARALAQAEARADYDRQLAKTLIALKNGTEFVLDEETIQNPPATTTEKIARGLCWKQKLEMEKSESLYRNASLGLNSLMSELSALQSVLKYLEEV